jgi:hypothetical protein
VYNLEKQPMNGLSPMNNLSPTVLLLMLFRLLLCVVSSGCDSFEPIAASKSKNVLDRGPKGLTPQQDTISEEELRTLTDPSYGKKRELRFLRAPKLRSLEFPLSAGMNAIWGATGKDHLGRVYLGVSAWDGGDDPSASLWRYDPGVDSFELLGDINQTLSDLRIRKVNPFPETQIKIHSKIVQASDGKMYFASQDEHQEKADGSSNALFGGRLFALDPILKKWECIYTAPEGLIALAARGHYVVAQGYFGHVLYQYDVDSKSIKSKKLGTVNGHVSRNIFMDRRMHVYGIRVRQAAQGEHDGVYNVDEQLVRVSLVELDTQLEEVNDWPLEDYVITGTTSATGITGFCELVDGSIVFVAESGALWIIRLQGDRSELNRLGWIGTDGPCFCGGLFSPYGERFVSGLTIKKGEAFYRWNIFDIEKRQSFSLKLDADSQKLLQRPNLLAYGSETIDHESRAYVVGRRQLNNGKAPYVLQFSWE